MRPQLPPATALLSLALALAALPASQVGAARNPDPEGLRDLAARAISDDHASAARAIGELRQAGPDGLRALLDANAELVARHTGASASASSDEGDSAHWKPLAAAIDRVAAQKDAYASRLYWYTDFEAAKQAARESGKPILSLRLLGTLDAEYSCANSRFFRTALYANREVAGLLREGFILHWQSVRPVPKITIDFGDGRKVERTITGNSIHYVLDANGNVIDALPGLYGPKAFGQRLREAVEAERLAQASADVTQYRRSWHAIMARQDLDHWQADLQRAGVAIVPGAASITPVGRAADMPPAFAPGADGAVPPRVAPAPPAVRAAPLAVGKAKAEFPVVKAIAPVLAGPPAPGDAAPAAAPAGPPPPAIKAAPLARGKAIVETRIVAALSPEVLTVASNDAAWQKIAALHADEARLDDSSRALMASKNPAALKANDLTASKRDVESPLMRMVQNFERSMAEDTVRNEYTFHRTIHAWLASPANASEAKLAADVNALNERVYAELFLTPSSDPWLGLLPPDTYTALENDGVCPVTGEKLTTPAKAEKDDGRHAAAR